MDKLFRQVSVKDRLPEKDGKYLTNRGLLYFDANDFEFFGRDLCISVDYWLEEVELPSEKNLTTKVLFHNNTMYHDNNMQEACNSGIAMCYNYILNTLKGEKK